MTKTKYIIATLVCVLLFSVMVGFFAIYHGQLQTDLRQTACETLSELLEQQKNNFAARVETDINAIETLAKIIPYLPDEREERLRLLNALVKDTNFEYIILADTDGFALSSSGTSLNIADRSYFKSAMAGQTVLHGPRISSVNATTIIPLASPIKQNGQITGVISAAYGINALSDLILPSYRGQASAYITDSTGAIIYHSSQLDPSFAQNNLLTVFENVEFLSHDTYNDLVRKLAYQESGHTTFRLDGETRLMHYKPLGINDWTLFIAVPESVIATQRNSIFQSTAMLSAAAVLLLTVFALYALGLQKKRMKEKQNQVADLEFTAYVDTLTNMPNINRFKLDAAAFLKSHPDEPLMALKIDIQNFKMINEMFGFSIGDRMICLLADCINAMRNEMTTPSMFARVNADEFILLSLLTDEMAQFTPENDALTVQITKELSTIVGSHKITLRFGRYIFHASECDVQAMIEHVNLAHSMAKTQKESLIFDYNDQLRENTLQEARLENKMENALKNQEFQVYLQAKYDLQTGTVVGAEALIRWLEPDGTLIPPSDFIPLFERNGFILKLDMFVFESVCTHMQRFLKEGGQLLPVSINLSQMHLHRPDFVSDLAAIADRHGIPKAFLELELTESVLFHSDKILEDLLHRLHDTGFSLSMDDFGTGFSSLGLLKNLPLDTIKIDKTFFDSGLHDQRTRFVVETIMEMAKKLHIATVAEGVERTEQIDFLRQVGCDFAQGYFYARPIPAAQFFDSLLQGNESPQQNNTPVTLPPLLPAWNRQTPMAMYQVSQSALQKALLSRYGDEETCSLLRSSGHLAGKRLAEQLPTQALPLSDLMAYLADYFQQLGCGQLQVLQTQPDSNAITILVQEPADHRPPADCACNDFCQYTEGLLAGFLLTYTDQPFTVSEQCCQTSDSQQRCFTISGPQPMKMKA